MNNFQSSDLKNQLKKKDCVDFYEHVTDYNDMSFKTRFHKSGCRHMN